MDWPFQSAGPLVTISTYSLECLGIAIPASNRSNVMANISSGVWPSANRALYLPFYLNRPFLVRQMFTYNGASATGNIDVGIYSVDGTRLVSKGSTAQSGTNALQDFDITDTFLPPGIFYMALATDSGSTTFFRVAVPAVDLEFAGAVQQDSAFALPATATFAAVGSAYLPVFGLSGRSLL